MTLPDAMDMVMAEYRRSVEMHGSWWDYSTEQMLSVIINELMVEAGDAEKIGDIHGEHGMIRELAQVAATSIKAMMVLSGRPEGHLAGASRTAGAHSCLEGRVLPASPALHREKESVSNRPMDGAQPGGEQDECFIPVERF